MVLRSVLTKPLLRGCLVRCRHCRIFFLTHPRNAGRKDLGCPFGCRKAHRQQQSTIRSVAYYRDPDGKTKKRALNQKRSRPKTDEDRPLTPSPSVPVDQSRSANSNPLVLEYVRMVVSLIEARPVSRTEIIEMLQRVLRQHTMARRRKIDQAVAWLHENPP